MSAASSAFWTFQHGCPETLAQVFEQRWRRTLMGRPYAAARARARGGSLGSPADEHDPALERPRAALRRDRRRRDERPRAGRALARGVRDGLRPRRRVALPGAAAGG